MKKISFFVLVLASVLFSGCLPKKQSSAIQVNSTPVASVFVNGKLVGKTPYANRQMSEGEITLKLIPETAATALSSWEGKLKLGGGVLSVVNWEFAELEENSSGDILTLEAIKNKKDSSLAVVTSPDGVTVKVDGENRGFSPLMIDNINEGEHQITLSLNGYKERLIRAKGVNGYKLVINSKLAKEGEVEGVTPTPSSKVPSGKPTVTPKVTVTPRPTVALKEGSSVEIKETPTGWLRVRSGPSTSSAEVAKVYPKDRFPLVEKQTGWYKITYEEGKSGWISSQYAQEVTE